MYSLIEDIKKLLSVMLPILVAQISTAGITFINTTMAGHAGSDDLAGVSVGAGLFIRCWLPSWDCSWRERRSWRRFWAKRNRRTFLMWSARVF